MSLGRGLRAFDRMLGRALLDRERPEALALVRILVASVLLVAMLTHIGAVADYFSDASVLAGSFAREAFPTRFSVFFYVGNAWAVRGIFALGVLAHLCWVLGLYTRVAAVVAWVVWISMVGRHPLLYSLADQLLTVLSTLLMLMPAGRGWSLDARWRGKGGTVPVWCRRIFQLQLAVVYTATGLLKTGPTWHEEGTALYYSLANPYNRHFDLTQLLVTLQPWVLRPMTFAVLVFEVAFGPFVCLHWVRGFMGRPRRFPDLRWLFLPFGVGMHLGIQALLYVVFFSPAMIACYAAFLRPDELVSMQAFLIRVMRRRSPAADP